MADGDLTSVPRVKDFLKLTVDTDDGLLQALVTRYSAWVQSTALNRTITATDHSRRFGGWGGSIWVFPEFPAISVASVRVGGVDTTPLVAEQDYYFDDKALYLIGSSFPRGTPGNCLVEWRAGYEVIPDDLDQSVAEMVAFLYRQRDNFTVSSKTISGEAITFIQANAPQRVLDCFNNYRKVTPT